MRARRLAGLVVLAVAMAGAACPGDGPSNLTARERALVDWWLICFECETALDSVRALGARAPATVDSLNTALRHGPPPAQVAAADSVLGIAYARDSTWRVHKLLPIIEPRSTYVNRERERYKDGYRSRGAIGMGWIHSARAVQFLTAALSDSLPLSVRQAVIYARDSLPTQ